MPIKTIRWACQHERCKKTYSGENAAKRHEIICAFNPNNRACPTCKHDGTIAVKQGDGFYRDKPHCEADVNRDGRPWIMNCIHWEPKRNS